MSIEGTPIHPEWRYVSSKPKAIAQFRSVPEDFVVQESLGFAPSMEGEHLLLQLEKRSTNTEWLAQQLARFFRVPSHSVGYCGKKDRHAVTTQWFSVHLPKGPISVEPEDLEHRFDSAVRLLQQGIHRQKLRPGMHRDNGFEIRLRDVNDADALDASLEKIRDQGVPNYFGEQRFGRDFANLQRVKSWVASKRLPRQQRGTVLSAARSFLFNEVVSARVAADNWRDPLNGDPADFASGPLWGRGRSLAEGETFTLESRALHTWEAWCEALEHVGLNQERRALVLRPEGLTWSWQENDLLLKFRLPVGAFATSVLREVSQLRFTKHGES